MLSFFSGFIFSGELLALDLPKLAGRFQFKLVHSDGRKDQLGEIEITYFKDFKFAGAVDVHEALKFENEWIAIIKDKSGKSMISDESLLVPRPINLFKMDATESANSISAQPNSHTRLRLESTDANNLILSISHKQGSLNIGPHISLFAVWPNKPTTTVYLKRASPSGDSKSSGKPAPSPKGLQDGWPKFER
jgi:hypothetical protein